MLWIPVFSYIHLGILWQNADILMKLEAFKQNQTPNSGHRVSVELLKG